MVGGIVPWLSREEQESRNVRIMELWALGYSRQAIAERVDLTPQRISQIVNSFGEGWREGVTRTNRNRPRRR
jgi:hypothetical protein